ncbi:MAG: long-chain fatty acid--CoA ligase [Gemmatimonadetes bacterium]|nr:long-chain fatty acid--CoA ligase [Gemmatimonadota bacterium]
MDVRTLPELFLHSVERYDKPDALRYRRDGAWVDISARDLRRQVETFAFGLLDLGVAPGDRVALLSENRPGWAVADLAILSTGALPVPVYPTLAGEQIAYILRDCGCRVCVVSSRAQLGKVLSIRADTAVQRVVTLDPVAHGDASVLSLERVTEAGERRRDADPAALRQRLDGIDPRGVATILYTSGTTGRPKGVMLSHHNLLSNIEAALAVFDIGPSDVSLSLLPLSHIFERMVGHFTMLHAGATIAYAESMGSVARDMLEVRPTIVPSVPRLYEKIYGRAMDAALRGSVMRRRLFLWALAVGERAVEARLQGERVSPSLAARYAIARRLVFAKLQRRTGGRVRMFVSGGAPLSPRIAKFFWAAGLPVYEGYGLTETSPVIAINAPGATRLGTVGRPAPGVEVRIAEDGEILCKGPNVMLGYFGLPEETAATIRGGWLHTGDVGHLDRDGYLVITDRKKDLIKTSGGKYIAPQPIENRLRMSPLVSQAVVVGNRRKYACVLIVPDLENLRRHAAAAGTPSASDTELLANAGVQRVYEDLIEEVSRDLAPHESLRRCALVARDFSIEDGELTPTLKVKRNVVEQRHRERIDAMYDEKLEP